MKSVSIPVPVNLTTGCFYVSGYEPFYCKEYFVARAYGNKKAFLLLRQDQGIAEYVTSTIETVKQYIPFSFEQVEVKGAPHILAFSFDISQISNDRIYLDLLGFALKSLWEPNFSNTTFLSPSYATKFCKQNVWIANIYLALLNKYKAILESNPSEAVKKDIENIKHACVIYTGLFNTIAHTNGQNSLLKSIDESCHGKPSTLNICYSDNVSPEKKALAFTDILKWVAAKGSQSQYLYLRWLLSPDLKIKYVKKHLKYTIINGNMAYANHSTCEYTFEFSNNDS